MTPGISESIFPWLSLVGAAVPVTRENGRVTAAILAYFSYELPFR